jgi:hypothetical protein
MPDEVRRAREEFERVNEANRAILEPRIEAHLTARDAALTELEDAHRLVADETALALDAETTAAALWLLTGRSIGLARAAYDLAVIGYATETIPLLRSLHESVHLLSVFTLPGEDALVLGWLQGRHVPRREVVAAKHRQEEAARVEMIKQGIRPPGTTRSFYDRQYGRWSEFDHHRRRHIVDQVAVAPRIMAVGRHPDWRARAASVDHLGWFVVELVSVGGSALGRLLGMEWYRDRFLPTFRALIALKQRIPLAAGVAAGEPPGSSTDRED